MINSAMEIGMRNKGRIRAAIQQYEKCTKAEIARETGLSMATCHNMLNEMLEQGEVVKVDQTESNVGRPTDHFAYRRDYIHALGICVDEYRERNNIDYALSDSFGRIIERKSMRLDEISYERIEALIGQAIKKDPHIKVIGLGIPGFVQDGIIEFCDVKELEKINFGRALKDKFDIRTIIENDMNIVTYYHYDQSRQQNGFDDGAFASIYFPDRDRGYVGAGFIVNGHILKGSTMFSGELAHIAKAFGISLKDQEALLDNHPLFLKFASQILLAVICVINPARVVIIGNNLTESDAASIRSECMNIIQEHHIPDIQINNSIFENYIDGLLRLTLDSVLFPFLL
jgi:predicted NBD/HSP70 family sugar kinase